MVYLNAELGLAFKFSHTRTPNQKKNIVFVSIQFFDSFSSVKLHQTASFIPKKLMKLKLLFFKRLLNKKVKKKTHTKPKKV